MLLLFFFDLTWRPFFHPPPQKSFLRWWNAPYDDAHGIKGRADTAMKPQLIVVYLMILRFVRSKSTTLSCAATDNLVLCWCMWFFNLHIITGGIEFTPSTESMDAAYCGNIIYSYNIDIRSVILINQDGVSEGGDATSPTLYVEDYGRCVCCHLPPRMETSTEALHPITISSRAVSDR